MIRKLFIYSILFLIFFSTACTEKKEAPYKKLEPFDYTNPSVTIVEITEKTGNNKERESAKLNLSLTKEKSLSKKAEILIKINNLQKNSAGNN